MKNIMTFILIVIFSFIIILPFDTYALNFNNYNNSIIIYKLEEESSNTKTCSNLLGDVNTADSVAWTLQKILNYTRVISIFIVIVLSSKDFIFVIAKSDDDALAKAKKELIIRLSLILLIYFIPTITNVLLALIGIEPNCGIY